jgi:hypothetical protein
MQEITCRPDVLRIWDQEMSEQHIGPGLETLGPALFDQLAPNFTKARSGIVVAEPVARDEAKSHIDVAGTIAVTSLQAEICRPTYGEGMKVCLHKRKCSRGNLRQNVNRRQGRWINHQG